MQKNNYFLKFFIIFIPILIIFILATVYDFQITSFFSILKLGEYYTSDMFAIFFEVVGESALYILLAMSLSVIYWYIGFYVKNGLKFYLQILVFLACIFVSFLGVWRIYVFLGNYFNLIFSGTFLFIFIIFSIFFAFLYIYSLKNLKKLEIKKLFWFACLIILVATFSVLFTQLFKDIFGRMRFRAMNDIVDFSYYTPWYVFNGNSLANSLAYLNLPSEAFSSFPSGHTVATAITFCFWFLPLFYKHRLSKVSKFWCYFTPILLTTLVGIARMMAGAHFFTDVLFGILIVFLFLSIFVPYLIYTKKTMRTKRK